ncbi:7-cyano-7-deazaguanine synthase [Mesorhizobium sp. M1066]|uniref:7-cyano-7-deazaguanine synthase n=1 Tax=unclassified Mesorhizobium TaxID=325217 RepID=UPI00333A050E
MTNSAHIVVRGRKQRPPGVSFIDCVIGNDVVLDFNRLQDFSARLLLDIEQDLILLSGAVAFADRVVPRRRGSGWRRDLTLTLPVNAIAKWSSKSVYNALVDVLEFVTGDGWTFEFRGGAELLSVPQSSILVPSDEYVVIPSSEGLDSFLQWQLLKKEQRPLRPLRIQTSSRSINKNRNRSLDVAGGRDDPRLSLPVSISVGNHPEQSYRTRTFLFFALAALAAVKVGADKIVVGENGVGAIGPSLVPYGDECPHRTTHPAFTRRLAHFINVLLDAKIQFDHPQRFRTKGQVLTEAIGVGVTGWEKTHSCVRDGRAGLGGRGCGTCSGCLLRRTSLLAAGQSQDGFYWADLSASDLDGSRRDTCGRSANNNDIDIARHGIHAMSSLAALAISSKRDEIIRRSAWELEQELGAKFDATVASITSLVETHAQEWAALRQMYGSNGILNQQ